MKIKLLLISIIVFATISCEDFLGKNPDSRASLETPEDIAALLVAAYPQTSYIWFAEVMSDNATDIGPGAIEDDPDLRQTYLWETVDGEEQDNPAGYWYSCYTSIAAANAALEAIDRLEEQGDYLAFELNALKGEALMCRAYVHFMLVNLFAEHFDPAIAASQTGIPYVTQVETTPLVNYTALSVQKVYEAIEKDFTEAYPLISDDAYDAPKWHFNKQAAATFISRYYLYRGLEGDWEKVETYANEALNNDIESYLRDWLNTSSQSFDVFGVNYSKSEIPSNFLIQSKVSAAVRGWYFRYTMDLDLIRKRVVDGDPHPTIYDITNRFVFVNKAGGNTTHNCYSVSKFSEEFKRSGINANYGLAYIMLPSIVAEEAFFNLMEAYVMQNRFDDVIKMLNIYYSKRIISYMPSFDMVTHGAITSKYNNSNFPDVAPHFAMTDMQKIYLRCIVNIRASEFVGEGQRWFDIKRMHIPIEHDIYGGASITLTPDDSRRVINLPADAQKYVVYPTGMPLMESTDKNVEMETYQSIVNKLQTNENK